MTSDVALMKGLSATAYRFSIGCRFLRPFLSVKRPAEQPS